MDKKIKSVTYGELMNKERRTFGASGHYRIRIPLPTRQVRRMMQAMFFEGYDGELGEDELYFANGQLPVWLPAYDNVCKWLGDSHGKSLVLAGGPGTGKTMLARTIIPGIVATWYGRRFKVAHATELQKMGKELAEQRLLVIDDLGTEAPVVSEYGNRYTLLPRLLDPIAKRGGVVIITTNLTPGGIRDRYGARVYDRLAAAAEFVLLGWDKSLRGGIGINDITDQETADAWTRAGQRYAAQKERILARRGFGKKEYEARLDAWYYERAAECGMGVPEWLETKANDFAYLLELFEKERRAGTACRIESWLRAKGLARHETEAELERFLTAQEKKQTNKRNERGRFVG